MDRKAVIGIDPGKSGGYCYNIGSNMHLHKWRDAKTAAKNLYKLKKECEESMTPIVIYLEKVSASPIMGQSSAFKFGENYGQWQGLLDALDMDFILVAPQSWQMYLKKPNDLRGQPLKRWLKMQAMNRFGDFEVEGDRITLATCDALLIWEFGRRHL